MSDETTQADEVSESAVQRLVSRITHVAVLHKYSSSEKKAVLVPVGQSLDFDDGPGGTRKWLRPHMTDEWYLCEFITIDHADGG